MSKQCAYMRFIFAPTNGLYTIFKMLFDRTIGLSIDFVSYWPKQDICG